MDTNWKRPKEIVSQTELLRLADCKARDMDDLNTPCGGIYLTFGYEDIEKTKLIEVICVIGKGGSCGNCHLINFGKALSCWLQSPEPRYKIAKKLKKNFIESNCGNIILKDDKEYYSCHDYIAKKILKEIEKQIN